MVVIEGRGEASNTDPAYCSPAMSTLNNGAVVVSANPDNGELPATLRQSVLQVSNEAGKMVIAHLTVEMVDALCDALKASVE